jgi:hypothetical protein
MEGYKLDRNYKYHPPTETQIPKYEQLRAKGKELAELINALTPFSREQSIAHTHLETALMWANKAIAVNE